MDESAKIWTIVIGGITTSGVLAYHFFNLSGIGPIMGVIVGSVIGYFAQSGAQKRLWKRDFIIENIKTIYGPLYSASLKIEQNLLNMENSRYYIDFKTEEWNQIQNTYAYHMIDDEELRKEIENFYVIIGLFNDSVHYSFKRSMEIVQTRGSEFYNVKVRDIIYNIVTDEGGTSPSSPLNNCILFQIHPKDTTYYKTGKPLIQVSHQIGNTGHQLTLEKPEEIKQFDVLFDQMVEDVNHDPQLQQLKTMKLQIHTQNLSIREKLIKRINERHNL